MTFEDAIKESVRKYYDDKHDDTTLESTKASPNKYDKKYFDTFEQEILGKDTPKKSK